MLNTESDPQAIRPAGAAADASGAPRDLLYRSLFEHAPLEVHMWEVVRDAGGAIVNWRLVDANPAALASWGRRLDEVVGHTADEIFPGADAVRTFLPIVEEIMATGEPKAWETPFAGTAQVLRMVSIPVGDCFVSTGFDVTADRRRQRELEQALERLTQATQAGGVGLWDWDLTTDQVRYSDEWKRQLGHAPDEIADIFEEWRTRVHPDDLEPTMVRVRAAIAGRDAPYDVVFRMRHKDGSWRWILAQSSVVRDADGTPRRMVGSHIDITERRRLEERVVEAQKLESLGTLAAGIAHDFNNLLGAITGNLSLLRTTSPSAPEVPELLRSLDDAAGRAVALTTQLLTFAKGGAPVRDVASIRELLVESATFVTRGSPVRCEFDLADDLSAVEADVGQLSQVIGNLVINAVQAMPHGGTIRIGARNVTLRGEPEPGLAAGRYVRITVADEGPGIPADVLPRIFDPFFTTKASGSGLGLSSSYAIIARHGGRLAVASEPGHGAVFTIELPASDRVPRERPPVEAIPGTGRVLLMDDDAAIRTVLQRMLARLGYSAETCADGDATVRRYEDAMRDGSPFDVVILDLTIPGHQGGAAVLARLRAIDPDVTAIVASGYADDDAVARHLTHGFRGRLRKPFDMAALGAELARVLQREP